MQSCDDRAKDPLTVAPTTCTLQTENQYVFDLMKDFYFWYTEVPDVDPTQFASPEELLAALIYKPLDRFSGISNQQTQTLFQQEGQFIGIGLRLKSDVDGRLFVAFPFSTSPAANAGLVRGTEIISINGNQVSDLLTAEDYDNAWGDTSLGTTATLGLLLPGSSSVVFETLIREIVTVDSTQIVNTFTDSNGVKFGYLLFTNFFGGNTSTIPLDHAFESFKTENIDELILDLRYNGGGSISAATHLGSLIGGLLTTNQIFTKTTYNNRYSGFNSNYLFSNKIDSLSLNKIYVITTASTCSASEMLINALSPHIEVVTIGDTTCGKPVGFNPQVFCNKIINAVNFEFQNSNGDGDFYDGLPATCGSGDDLTQALGGAEDNAVQIASYYQKTNQCAASGKQEKQPVRKLYEIEPDRNLFMVGIY